MPILTTSGLCFFKAGEHATTSVSPFRNVSGSEFAVAIISGAEAYISSLARYNFAGNYSSLNTQTRDILSEAVSNYAAAILISHDMSKFTSRVEAESMINLYMDNFTKQVEILKDKKVSDFLKSGTNQ